jgi:hypothetical protein
MGDRSGGGGMTHLGRCSPRAWSCAAVAGLDMASIIIFGGACVV